MKKLLFLLLPWWACGQANKNVVGAKTVPAASLSKAQMYAAINGTSQPDDALVSMTQEGYNAVAAAALLGDNQPKEYGVTYASHPVSNAYATLIKPHIQVFIDLNDESYQKGFLKLFIPNAIANQLLKAVENANVFRTPGSRDKLRTEIINEYQNDVFGPESNNDTYHKDRLVAIWGRMFSVLSQTPTQMDAPFTGSNANPANSQSNNTATYNDFASSFIFLSSKIAAVNCAMAVIVAKSNLNTAKMNSPLTQLLDKAKWGTLYTPLTAYKNQSSFYDLYQINIGFLQTLTSGNALYLLYDPGNQCFNTTAFQLAEKIRSASVFNSK